MTFHRPHHIPAYLPWNITVISKPQADSSLADNKSVTPAPILFIACCNAFSENEIFSKRRKKHVLYSRADGQGRTAQLHILPLKIMSLWKSMCTRLNLHPTWLSKNSWGKKIRLAQWCCTSGACSLESRFKSIAAIPLYWLHTLPTPLQRSQTRPVLRRVPITNSKLITSQIWRAFPELPRKACTHLLVLYSTKSVGV